MSSQKKLQVQSEDISPQKWRVPLTENMFDSLISQGGANMNKIFGEGSLFSPLLFGKFFDPSDAFPLWDVESEILLSSLRNSGRSNTDWFETDRDYVVRAESPGLQLCNIQVIVENGKILEISGQQRQKKEAAAKDWRSGNWWEYGYVRRLELPENADWRKIKANIEDDIFLEIRIPKNPNNESNIPQGNDVASGPF